MSPVELRRILGEWSVRLQRVKDILQPTTWSEQEWRQFAQALALMVRDHGRSWIIDPNVYWDLRWRLQDGAELVCQIEHVPGEKTSLVVAQNGGFATEVGSYTWLWAEFNMEGNFSRDPYWVEGTWKEALTSLLLPLDRQASYLLAGRAETPTSLLLQPGARANDNDHRALLPGLPEPAEDKSWEVLREEPAATEPGYHPGQSESQFAFAESPAPQFSEAPAPEPQPELIAEPPSLAMEERTPEPEPFNVRWGTVYQLRWKDTDDIAYALMDKFPGYDPVKLTSGEIQQMVLGLENFADEPEKATHALLEAIQLAWYEEVS